VRLSEVLRSKSDHFVSLPPTASVVRAAMLMKRGGVGAVVVCDGRGRVLGVVSERDLVLALAETGDQFFRLCVGEVMTVDVPAATPNTAVQSVMRIMSEQQAGHMPVIENGVAVGMVSMGDVLNSPFAKRSGSTPSRRLWREFTFSDWAGGVRPSAARRGEPFMGEPRAHSGRRMMLADAEADRNSA
jgi:CBS domain-containing protein